MEKEKPFKLFSLPRLNNSQVSAVKPQSIVESACIFQGFKPPFGIGSSPTIQKHNLDYCSQKLHLPVIDEENTESVNQLYSKLYREAERIKKWKFTIESDINQKEKKLQENKKTIDVQRKAIQELQFENEKLSLKLEDEIHENKDLINQFNATRHVCDLLKDTCARAAEKANLYENEREDNRQVYEELSNNMERLIMAFEELRFQAENSREEIYIKLQEEAEKRKKKENDYMFEINASKQQISELTKEKDDMHNKLMNLNFQLNESKNKLCKFEEMSKVHDFELEKSVCKVKQLFEQVEEAKMSLENAKDEKRNVENELQKAQELVFQAKKEKQLQLQELELAKAEHALKLSGFESTVDNLKELLNLEQARLKESECSLKNIALDIQKKSMEVEELTHLKEYFKTELEEAKLQIENLLKLREDMEKLIAKEKSENQNILQAQQEKEQCYAKLQEKFYSLTVEKNDLKMLLEELQETQKRHQDSLDSKEEKIYSLTVEKNDLKMLLEELQETQKHLQDSLDSKEKEMHVLKTQVNISSVNEDGCCKKMAEMKAELENKEIRYTNLLLDYEKFRTEKEVATRSLDTTAKEMKSIQKDLKASKQYEERTKNEIENLKEQNHQLRKEAEYLKEQLKQKSEDFRNQLEEYVEKAKNFEGEVTKKEKQLKSLDNKVNTLKKQIENKTKTLEEVQQENKILKKKIAEETKQKFFLEAEVKELHIQLEGAKIDQEKTVNNNNKEIEDAKIREESLTEEVDKLKGAAEEAIKSQKETEIRCQHKIAEMVALMEKHKLQYDKMVEEKDTELGRYRTMEQEISSTKVSLETDLANKKNEVNSLTEKLEIVIEEKEKLSKALEESKNILQKEVKNKKVQTSLIETPKQSIQKIEYNTQTSSSKKSLQTHLSSFLETNKQSDKRNTSSCTLSKSDKYTPQRSYAVKTPPKCGNVQYGNIDHPSEDSDKKKRKVALEFDFHSDSSEQTDLLGICEDEELFKKLYQKRPPPVSFYAVTPKKMVMDSLLKSPGQALRNTAVKKMRDSSWQAVSKVDRRRKMKVAEKLFN